MDTFANDIAYLAYAQKWNKWHCYVNLLSVNNTIYSVNMLPRKFFKSPLPIMTE